MKKICLFISDMGNSGGTERVSSILINQLCDKGLDVHVLNLYSSDKPFFQISEKIQYNSLNNVRGAGLTAYFEITRKLRAYLRTNQINCLITVESMLAIYAVPAVWNLKLNHIVWEHFNYHVDLGRRSRRIARHLAALRADNIVTLTERDKQFWLAESFCFASVSAISNPLTFDVSNELANINSKSFLSVGRLVDQKGYDLLIKAWSIVIKVHPEWKLNIVGNGERRDDLTVQIEKLNLSGSVNLIPATKEIDIYYKNASAYVMSSRYEGFPMVLLEAMCFGLPIVSFDCNTGPGEMIEHGITGWLSNAEDVQSLAESMITAINSFNDPEFYACMSNSSLRKATEFNVESFITKWEKILLCNG
ncbi:glycosyltransferase family 4 protein [Alkalimonas mucilaginosa]|uniref:Glycosyltransferase family 4 protein n=1 Tax=Alkalimonas mucilaginosa TaxID=3057676 RepID=A0ABU7JDB3_9GAMM|nr:glycosyltransferase family 4 protein [Alkalimonas sp. MEB004]MEE2023033.1 glycosyltransferase family 4 protein [Alkalimonas sp. MEB004]